METKPVTKQTGQDFSIKEFLNIGMGICFILIFFKILKQEQTILSNLKALQSNTSPEGKYYLKDLWQKVDYEFKKHNITNFKIIKNHQFIIFHISENYFKKNSSQLNEPFKKFLKSISKNLFPIFYHFPRGIQQIEIAGFASPLLNKKQEYYFDKSTTQLAKSRANKILNQLFTDYIQQAEFQLLYKLSYSSHKGFEYLKDSYRKKLNAGHMSDTYFCNHYNCNKLNYFIIKVKTENS